MAENRFSTRVMKSFRDKDYIYLRDTYFSVVGYEHPPGRIVAYPKYIRTKAETYWCDSNGCFERLLPFYGAIGLEEALRRTFNRIRGLLVYDPVFDAEVPEVPRHMVTKHLVPEDAWSRVLGRDKLEVAALELLDVIRSHAGVEREALGLTGTILLGIHNEAVSDIDVVVIGLSNVLRVKDAVIEGGIGATPSRTVLMKWLRKSHAHGLTSRDAEAYYGRKWYRGLFKGFEYSVSFVDDSAPSYGHRRYVNIGSITIVTRIREPINPFFIPVEYSVESRLVRSVASYDGFYADVLRAGDLVEVHGLLQEVREGEKAYRRIVVGVREVRDGYIKLLKERQ